ncbi:MAG: hypothetical protein WCE64_13590, partial [Bacteroidales bacterium]
INVLCLDNDSDNIVGKPFPTDGMITNNLELDYRYKMSGDKWGCIRLDLVKDNPFPSIKGKYYPENFLWYGLSKKYNIICFNKPLYRYYTTFTGISQTELNKTSLIPSRIRLKYKTWIISNFGYYILVHSPIDFLRISASIVKHSVLWLFRRLKGYKL